MITITKIKTKVTTTNKNKQQRNIKRQVRHKATAATYTTFMENKQKTEEIE